MKLIVGLGNPGKEYNNTRHNVGYMFIDYYLNKKGINVKWTNKFKGKFINTTIGMEKVLFLKPETYMNLSGESIKKIMDYYSINIEDLLIISDDLDLNIGNFKLKDHGSSAGHNGLKNIELNLKSNNYKRLKIGISKHKDIDVKNYVLGHFSKEENDIINDLFEHLLVVLDDYFILSYSDLMSKYNRKNR